MIGVADPNISAFGLTCQFIHPNFIPVRPHGRDSSTFGKLTQPRVYVVQHANVERTFFYWRAHVLEDSTLL
jgi:hypothetical protein